MSFLKFGDDGKLLLTGSMKREKDEEESSIILTKLQVSESSPAKAQLKIRLGRKISGDRKLFTSLREQCEKYVQYKQASSQTNITTTEEEITVESKSSWDMYTYLKELMMNIKNNNYGNKVVVRGSWAKE